MAGDVIEPIQLIFGGKTKRCHPLKGTARAPEGIYYDHSTSHWQTPATFIRYINTVLIPYRNRMILYGNLRGDQKMIYIMDLHYSHKDEAVLALLAANNIIPIFIPGGCTDLHQVCDLVVNKPYKNGVTDAFIDYLSDQFKEWYANRNINTTAEMFHVNLAASVMKPLLPNFVKRGIAALKTPAMRNVITNSFLKDGLVAIAKLPETYHRALVAFPEVIEDLPVPAEVEEEEDLGPVEDEEDLEITEQLATMPVFDIEPQNDTVSLLSTEESDSESDCENEEITSGPVDIGKPTRIRKINSMHGSVKRGKYSVA